MSPFCPGLALCALFLQQPPPSPSVPDGFAVERLYAVPAEQGSWVSLAFDPKGRLHASDQYGPIYRVEQDERGAVTRATALALPLGEAHGLLFAFDALYAVVTRGEHYDSGLYRARDTDGDGELDRVELLHALPERGGEHGPHCVRLGPDGKSLYVLAGNHTDLPEPMDSRVPRVWAEDSVLPIREDPNGHAVGVRAPGGWLARCDADGQHWELVAAGMRNAYRFDFDRNGEAFTFDSDMEWDIGLPWYKPTRVLHLMAGAEYGWRSGSANWPAWYPETPPAVVDIGPGSPTGVLFGYGLAFPAEWRERLFLADWAGGRILALQRSVRSEPPRAPRYASDAEHVRVFASGPGFPVTDIAAGPEGGLYVATGGRRASASLYRIHWSSPLPRSHAAPAADALPVRPARLRAQALERADATAARALLERELLPEPRAGQAALLAQERALALEFWSDPLCRASLERLPAASWTELVLARRTRDARIDSLALLSAIRACGADDSPRIWGALDALDLAALTPAERAEHWRVLGLACIRHGEPAADARERWLARLGACWPAPAEGLTPEQQSAYERELAELLVRLRWPRCIEVFLPRALAVGAQEERIHYLWILRNVHGGWSAATARQWLAACDPLIGSGQGGYSFRKYLEGARADFLEQLPEALRASLQAPAPSASPALAAAPVVSHWTLDSVLALEPKLSAAREAARGRAAFTKAQCATCHRMNTEGGGIGPDLSTVGSRFVFRDLVDALVLPSKAISDQYADSIVSTQSGGLHVGRVEREDAEHLWLRVRQPEEELVEIDKAELETRKLSAISPMPEKQIDVLSEEELLDLLAFLLAARS